MAMDWCSTAGEVRKAGSMKEAARCRYTLVSFFKLGIALIAIQVAFHLPKRITNRRESVGAMFRCKCKRRTYHMCVLHGQALPVPSLFPWVGVVVFVAPR